MSKYLELFKGSFNDSINEKTKLENKPYIGYSLTEGKVVYTVVPKEPTSVYQMVDLGLPSGLKWADRNVGAASPEDNGLYFQWGDTVGYTADQVGKDKVFDWENYKFGTDSNLIKYNSTDGLTVLESIDDAATVHMGSQYRMPTEDETQELVNNTTQTFIDLDGNEYSIEQAQNGTIEYGKLKGVRFTGSNGNSIFIPATGIYSNSTLYQLGSSGFCWYSLLIDDSSAGLLLFGLGGASSVSSDIRCSGCVVRGVHA